MATKDMGKQRSSEDDSKLNLQYFTRDTLLSEDEKVFPAACQAYKQRLQTIGGYLPVALSSLIQQKISLHDAIIKGATYNSSSQLLKLELRAAPVEGFQSAMDVEISYKGCELSDKQIAKISQIVSHKEGAALIRDELDVLPSGKFVHRMSTSVGRYLGKVQMAITFRDAEFVAKSVEGHDWTSFVSRSPIFKLTSD